MEVIEKNCNEVICEGCRSKLRFNKYDLTYYWDEPDYYYIVCPECGNHVWVGRTPFLDSMYNEVTEELTNAKVKK